MFPMISNPFWSAAACRRSNAGSLLPAAAASRGRESGAKAPHSRLGAEGFAHFRVVDIDSAQVARFANPDQPLAAKCAQGIVDFEQLERVGDHFLAHSSIRREKPTEEAVGRG